MDPLTAIFNFLSTPAGQKIALGIEDAIQNLVKLFHQNAAAAGLVVAPTPAPPKPAAELEDIAA
ncbi:MAG: hypothetical protein ACRD9L_16335 [Bryobacteraceae bacterium]